MQKQFVIDDGGNGLMRIDGKGSHHLALNRQAADAAGKGNGAGSSFAAALSGASSESSSSGGSSSGPTTRADFSHMTRKDLADWVNSRIKSGEMSLDGSETFVGMTMKMPVNGPYTGLDDIEQVDFLQTAQGGMEWARQHNDKAGFQALQAALTTMQRYQG
ncbi:MAG: hypothetical protein ACOY5R_05760 [Pseudomonadota bacterium]